MSRAVPLPPRVSVFGVHLCVAVVASWVTALADLLSGPVLSSTQEVRASSFLLAGLHLGAIYSTYGLVAGILLGIAEFPAVRIPAFRTWRATGSRLFEPDPWVVSRFIAYAIRAVLLFVSVALAHIYAVHSFHRIELASYVVGVVALTASILGVLSQRSIEGLLFPVIFIAGRMASKAVLFAIGAACSIGLSVVVLQRNPELLVAYDLRSLLWPLVTLVIWILTMVTLGARLRRLPSARVRLHASWLSIGVLLVLVCSATTYGRSNRVRTLVEHHTVGGRRLIRGLGPLTDLDGDHYTWAFGGGDCDDLDPRIHPGTMDEPGDGVDSDCFGGDGSPIVLRRTRGEYGAQLPTLRRPNFLVITIDTLRRDHLGSANYSRRLSPTIDAFAQTAVVFDSVIPQSSRSMRSIPAMWTGNYPSEIAYGPEYLMSSLLEENVTAPELLRDHAGYRTAAVIGTDHFERMADFFQGFGTVIQTPELKAPRGWVVREGLEQMRAFATAQEPWLVWLHLFNTHVPYLHDRQPSRFGAEPIDQYDTEIALVDEEVRTALDGLSELGQQDGTVVVIASDHGEAFGEHGSFGHATTLYEEELNSVLMFRAKGVPPRRIAQLVGLLDVAPTLLNFAGVPLPGEISGLSLLPFMTGERAPDPARTIFSELMPDGLNAYDIKVLRVGSEKLLWWVRDGTLQYFDLSTDPHERHDLSDEREEEAAHLFGELRSWVNGSSRPENRSDVFVEANRLSRVPAGITTPLSIEYPEMFTVVGMDLPKTTFRLGDTIPLTFYYRVDQQIADDLFFYVDILGPPGVRIPQHFHAWHYPMHSRYPTTRWVPGEIVRDPTPIVIPRTLTAPVQLTIALRVRRGDGLLIAETSDGPTASIPLAQIDVSE